jgi:SAM-dependent methyltransferase
MSTAVAPAADRRTEECPSCESGAMETFFELKGVPTNSCILLPTLQEALDYPRGDIRLAYCRDCGFISNMAFDARLTEYSGRYEETQGFSETFNAFHRDLARRLIERHDLRGKDVLEIGCGKGEFLALLVELGQNRGVGFDPGYREDRTSAEVAKHVVFVKDFYSERYATQAADFVCCKMTLEHIHPTAQFVSMVRRAIGDRPDTVVFFQIPETTRIVRDCAFEDIYYEHCSYFTPGSLARLFRRSGFDVLDLDVEYAGQYLTIEAKPARGPAPAPLPQEADLEQLARYVAGFPEKCTARLDAWRERVKARSARGARIVLWGSGSKGVAFLTTLGVGDYIQYAVDINPYRQGFYMPTTGQRIVGPAFLREYRPDTVIIMNPIYRVEIERELGAMGLAPEILTL